MLRCLYCEHAAFSKGYSGGGREGEGAHRTISEARAEKYRLEKKDRGLVASTRPAPRVRSRNLPSAFYLMSVCARMGMCKRHAMHF